MILFLRGPKPLFRVECLSLGLEDDTNCGLIPLHSLTFPNYLTEIKKRKVKPVIRHDEKTKLLTTTKLGKRDTLLACQLNHRDSLLTLPIRTTINQKSVSFAFLDPKPSTLVNHREKQSPSLHSW
ncbi:hypothetical protein CEXT_241531 [Caerostris extrusa]|uniref:Uncharacterized protein n=1 Tax=Caerostris extrusa TaxID=172846 RepID=A0AAV4TJP5_CAEEX|nr:hypothetical protein CEXT_241531 [Caerostris extrusa]